MKTTKTRIQGLFLLLITIFFLYLGTSFAIEAKMIKFTFNPKNGTTFIQTLTTTREKDLGLFGTQVDESVSTTKITVKKTEGGWEIIAQPLTAVMKRNGQVVEHPIFKLLSKLVITYQLDQQGVLKEIIGYDEVLTNALFPPQVVKKVAPLLNADALKQKAISEWNGRIGDYLGKTISLGDSWEAVAPITLPNGTNLNYKITTHFKTLEPCGNIKCLRIEQNYESDVKGIAEKTNEVIKSLAEGVEPNSLQEGLPVMKDQGSSIQGTVIRLIDPNTMLIYQEELERTMFLEMELAGTGPIPTKMIEKRIYHFEY
jgi:hypothetical protein